MTNQNRLTKVLICNGEKKQILRPVPAFNVLKYLNCKLPFFYKIVTKLVIYLSFWDLYLVCCLKELTLHSFKTYVAIDYIYFSR